MQNIYLRKLTSGYAFRRRVPPQLAARVGKTELFKSLGPCDAMTARIKARELTVQSDRLFSMVRGERYLTSALADELAITWFRELLTQHETDLGSQSDKADMPREIEKANEDIEAATDALASNNWMGISEVADRVLAAAHVETPQTDDDSAYINLCRKLFRALKTASEVQLDRLRGDYTTTPSDPLFSSALNTDAVVDIRAAAAQRPVANLIPATPIAPSESDPMLLDAIDKHVAQSNWVKQVENQNKMTLRLFGESTGNKVLSQVGRHDVSEFIASLKTLPRNWGQVPAYRKLAFPAMLKLADKRDRDKPRLSSRTMNRHIASVSGLFTWARRSGRFVGENPATDFIDKKASSTINAERRWRPEELEKLFRSDVWRSKWAKAKPSQFFIPLIGLYAGMRLEEICKLQAGDVRTTDGMPVFDVVSNEAGRVKENNSERTVPIHPALVEVGLLKHVDAIRSNGGGHLWPELKRSKSTDTFSHNYSKWFRLDASPGTEAHIIRGQHIEVFVFAYELLQHAGRYGGVAMQAEAECAIKAAADAIGSTFGQRWHVQGVSLTTLFDYLCREQRVGACRPLVQMLLRELCR